MDAGHARGRDERASARIVVGIDGSDACLAALAFAARTAAAREAELVAVRAGPRPLEHPLAALWDHGGLDDEVLAATTDELHAFLAAHDPGHEVTPHVALGSAAGVLLAAADHAELLVIGARGRGVVAGPALGSTSQLVATHASVPVAVVPGDVDRTDHPWDGPVVVGVDGSPEADRALAWAADHAAVHGLPLRVVLVYDYLSQPATSVEGRGFDPSFTSQDADEVVTAIARRVLGERPSQDVTAVAELGLPRPTLLTAASGASALVVGNRGRGGFAGLLLGSTSLGILRRATCPVVIHRGHDRPRPGRHEETP